MLQACIECWQRQYPDQSGKMEGRACCLQSRPATGLRECKPEPVLTGHFRFPVTESCRRWGWGSPRSPRPWTRWTGSAGCKPDRRWCRLKLPPKVSSQLEAEIIFWASWRGRFVLRITVVYSLARVAEWQNHIDKISYLKSKFFEWRLGVRNPLEGKVVSSGKGFLFEADNLTLLRRHSRPLRCPDRGQRGH